TARAEITGVAHLLETRFAQDAVPVAKPPTPTASGAGLTGGARAATVPPAEKATGTVANGGTRDRIDDDPSVPTLPFPTKKSGGKAGAVVRPPPPPRVQALRLPTEAALLATGADGAGGATPPPSDTELAERVTAAVADAVAKGVGAQPVVVYRATARYPEAQRRAGIPGEAKVRFTINAAGQPEGVREAGSTVPDFAKAAIESVKQWRFIPGIREGKPVSTLVELTLTFGAEGMGK
ncbi:MAG: energy transducer TonB, partial [Verrucomicrobia bacterium]|nr:energy transducer TonB [Verrucomicrobiota bacterium]